ncbi:NAD(P)H-binding protein [Paenibacillus gallinarum]|uniref:NAD(P)H-binding protein n=1 Tax=Paenibacillus gallinarum TaxID=2762232 RepID=A0ABR8T326_9BACL|nr:NAD(P)H-binding protein [Paenibacillus gallinarum]MBD7970161.1 NAD(P)H-binding protein [Paenibacillus gallinarum]
MDQEENYRPVIALTGASGNIGQYLMTELQKNYDIIAISRSRGHHINSEHVTWCACDFFSYEDAEKALRGADYAIYLIHSMLPSAKLTQGSFEDMDAILAELFARAAQRNSVKKIVYVSEMIPPEVENKDVSRHLRGRLEVERILGSYDIPVTTLQAGPFVSPSSSSSPITGLAKKSMKSDVRSIQRICLPEGKNAHWVLHYYIEWLSRITKPFIRISRSEDQIVRIFLRATRAPLLELTYDKTKSSPTYASYRISSGTLVNRQEVHNGRLEFLQLPNSRECIVAIHDYVPSLPWFIYKYTQAKLHLWVMKAFDLHLKQLSKHSK